MNGYENKRDIRLGERRLMNCGLYAEIIEYKNSTNITVKFEDGTISSNKQYGAFNRGILSVKTGGIHSSDYRKKRLHEVRQMNCELKAEVIGYEDAKHVTLKFENGDIKENVQYCHFKVGKVHP